VGRLGKQPELKSLDNDNSVANFSVATSEKWVKDGEKQEATEWHRVVCFGKLAEICEKYLDKGSQVYVEGKLQTRSWEDKEGAKRYTTEILAKSVQFLSTKPSGESNEEKF